MPRLKQQRLKRRKDGRYCCTYQGKQFMGWTEREALDKREEYKRQLDRGEYLRQNGYTVSEYAAEWLPLYKGTVSPKCYADYKKQVDALCAAIGKRRMDAVSVDDAAAVWQHYAGYSASTIKRARMLYISIFDTAIENEICRRNPFRGRFAQPPKAPSGSHRCITDAERALILSTPHRVQLAAILMLYAGLRRGEVLALTCDDIENNEIIVNKAVRFDGNRPVIVAPKTASGVRRVPVFSVAQPFLANAPQRILASAKGEIMTDTAFRRAWDSYLHALTLAAGHPVNIRPHDLRHTYCTLLADAGVSIKQAMQWMGHADEKMILHIYDHVTDTRTIASISKVESHLLSMQNPMQQDSKTTVSP